MADREDKEGNASKNTARIFFMSSILFEVLKMFGELEPDVIHSLSVYFFRHLFLTFSLDFRKEKIFSF
jgi:hypothetical protein